MTDTPTAEPILIKRYAGARLYDAAAERYRTIEELRRWAAERTPFMVRDAKTREDVTRSVIETKH